MGGPQTGPEPAEEGPSITCQPPPVHLLIVNVCRSSKRFRPLNLRKMPAELSPLVMALTFQMINQLSEFSSEIWSFSWVLQNDGLQGCPPPPPTS